jgi:membrane protein YqaA with SNARE-associated domain
VPVLLIFTICLASAALPVFGSEVVIVGAALRTDGFTCALLIVVAAAAQSIGKLVVYASAERGARTVAATRLGIPALRASLDRSRLRVAAVIFASALASLPPLFATAIVCGAARYGRLAFCVAVFTARLIRYACLIWILRFPS